MQVLKFGRRTHGTSKKGNEYDMCEVSDGFSSFTLSNADGIGKEIDNMSLSEGDEFQAEVHVSTSFGSLRGTIVAVDQV